MEGGEKYYFIMQYQELNVWQDSLTNLWSGDAHSPHVD
jgi:hypothetical protein